MEPGNVDEQHLAKIHLCAEALIRYVNDEHATLIAAHTVDDDTAKIFRAFKKNISAFTPEDINHLTLASSLSALKNKKGDNRRQPRLFYRPPFPQNTGYNARPAYQPQVSQPRVFNNYSRPRFPFQRAPEGNWRPADQLAGQSIPRSRPPYNGDRFSMSGQQY